MKITYVTTPADLAAFHRWLPRGVVAFDTETTGLNIYGPNFRMRLLQLGDAEEAWVFPETNPHGQREAWKFLMETDAPLTAHNAPFDIAVLDQHFGDGTWNRLFARTIDTYVLAHLRDPSGDHGLKDVVTEWLPDAADSQKELKRVAMEEYKLPAKTWHEIFTIIAIDHPVYVHYAGYDTILSAIAYRELLPLIHSLGMSDLIEFEHAVAKVTAGMQRRGLQVDVERAHEVAKELETRQERGLDVAASYGIQNVNSTAQVSEALLTNGAHLVEKTKGGKWKVDKAVLSSLIKLHEGEPVAELAQAITDAKQAGKWRTSYVDASLAMMDANNVVHANINSLRARTARMAVDTPPFHQLPSGDSLIRSMFGGQPGDLFFSVDYAQIEMRVLAVMANEPTMIEAIASGLDLHSATAEKMFGPDFTKKQRGMAKSCLVPGSKVLRSDLRWVNAEDLKVGDHVLGFDAELNGVPGDHGRTRARKFRSSRVYTTGLAPRQTVGILLADGTEIVGSQEHPILVQDIRYKNSKYVWVTLGDLDLRFHKVRKWSDMWDTDESWEAGWLAGMLDGEGWFNSNPASGVLGIVQNPGAVADKLRAVLGDEWIETEDKSGIRRWRMRGGTEATARLLGSIQSLRLIPKWWSWIDGRTVQTTSVAVVKKWDAGVQAVVTLGTDTETYVAQGVLNHNTGFGKVYGGGATTIARQTGATVPEAKKAITMYDRTYPGVKSYARYEMDKARLNHMVTISPSGRRMPLDRDRVYAVTNYIIQSTARDILAQALLILEERKLDQYLYLPVHDEVIGSAPADQALEIATLVAEAMSMPFGALNLDTEAEIAYDHHWGTLYLPNGVKHTINR